MADTRNDRVQRFASDGSNPTVIIPKGTVMRPNGLVVVGSRLIVADNWRHKLAIFDTGGRFLRNVGDGEGNRPNQFFHPYDVAADPAGRLYVADNSNHRIVRYGPAPSYKYRARWGAFGSGRGQLQYPRGLAVDGTGRTFVADPGGNRIDVFDIGGTSLGAFGKSGREAGQFIRPQGVGADASGPARGRRHRQRADPAHQPRRQRGRDVRRARAGPDAAARPGRGRLRQLRAVVRRRPAALARDRLRPRGQDHPHDRQPRPRARAAARAVRAWRSTPTGASTSPTPATAGSFASPPPARISAPSGASARCAGVAVTPDGARVFGSDAATGKITVMTGTGGDLAEIGARGSDAR